MTHKAQVGSISSGTLLTADLISAFVSELDYLTQDQSHAALLDEANKWLEQDEDARDEEEGHDLANLLFDALDEHAPPYCYFGAHEGNGSDFGFWPSWECIDELPCISDPSEHPVALAETIAREAKICDWPEVRKAAQKLLDSDATGQDCKFVNDHGNVTVYGADGSVLLELV